MTSKSVVQDEWAQAGDEVVDHLRELLRLDTRNPPGNEIRAARYLQAVLDEAGIPSTIVGPTPERATIVARLAGDGSERPLLLMSHTDVVAVEPEQWTHDPFAADIDGGWLYGRGALDMKHMVAMELQTLLLLKRRGVPLKRDVIFMAAADEEIGDEGACWMVENRPDLISAEYALNEGGGDGDELNGRRYYSVQAAEKGSARFCLSARGRPGHGSVPHDDNAILKLAERLRRLQARRLPVHLTPTAKGFITATASVQPDDVRAQLMAILDPDGDPDAAIDALTLPDDFKYMVRAIIRNTASPTMLNAGSQINVIPSLASVMLDGRNLPGSTPEAFRKELLQIVGEDAEIELTDSSEPLEVDIEGPMLETIKSVLAERDPGATVVPVMLTGATDAKHVSKLGTRVYGFAPGLYSGPGELSRIHGHDERIAVESLRWGARTLYEVVERFCR